MKREEEEEKECEDGETSNTDDAFSEARSRACRTSCRQCASPDAGHSVAVVAVSGCVLVVDSGAGDERLLPNSRASAVASNRATTAWKNLIVQHVVWVGKKSGSSAVSRVCLHPSAPYWESFAASQTTAGATEQLVRESAKNTESDGMCLCYAQVSTTDPVGRAAPPQGCQLQLACRRACSAQPLGTGVEADGLTQSTRAGGTGNAQTPDASLVAAHPAPRTACTRLLTGGRPASRRGISS